MRTRTRFLAVAAVALFAAQVRAQESLGEPIKTSVSLSEVTSFPEAYKRVPFDLELLFHGPRDLYNPYYTLFEPASYLNFAAWSADQPIWTRDAYVNDYPFFYVDRKNSALEHQTVSMKPFTWFTARCIVRNSAQGRAWIEVLSVTQTAATLDTADLRHLVRANVLASGGEFDRALLEFGMAKMFGAPPKFVARYHADEGRTALAANQPGRAMSELTAALSVLPDDKELVALLDRTSNAIQGDNKQQVASVPSGVPPPLNLNDGPAPKPLAAKPVEAKPAPAKATEPKPAAEAPKAVVTTPTPDPTPATTEAPKADAKKTESPKVEATKVEPSTPAAEPKVDPTPAPKSEPVVPPKSDAPKVPADKPAGKDAPPPAPDAPKEAPPAPDVPKADGKPVDGTPAEKKDGDVPAAKPEAQPDPDAPKDGDKPEEKKDGDPAPDAPKPDSKPEEKPAGEPDSKPADKPADEPKSGGR